MGAGFSVPSPGTILLLESEPNMRSALRDALENAGYLVLTAGDLDGALGCLAETPPDLLITAPYVNSMPGRVAVDYLRRRQNGLPVLMVAGLLDDDRVNVEETLEEFHVFPKPFHREDLIAKVKDVMETIRGKTA